MTCLQCVLTARFRRLKAPFGSDLVYAFHREITVAVLAFLTAHPLLPGSRRSHAVPAVATLVLATLHIVTERHCLELPWKWSR